jgi:hypothetical protein
MEMQVNTEQRLEAEAALQQLAAQAPNVEKRSAPQRPPLKFAFTEIGEQIIASLMKAADEQVEAAQALRVEVMQLADNIATELDGYAKRLEAMQLRTKEFGLSVVDAHKKFINGANDAKG